MSLIGIDLGTSFIKGAILDPDSRSVRDVERVPCPGPVTPCPPGHYEIDPRAVVSATKELLGRLLSRVRECRGVVMCGQMHALVLTDDRGEPRSNAIVWLDQRATASHPSGAGSFFEVLLDRIGPTVLRQLGNGLRPGMAISTLFWLAETRAQPLAGTIAASLPDFVIANLTGSTPCTEPTHAAAHGALNLETLRWHEEAIARLGLDSVRWPAIRRLGEPAGFLEEGGMRVPCYTPVGDQQCALAGALLAPGELSINVSTGSQVAELAAGLELGRYETRPYFDGGFLKTVTGIPAGRALNTLVRLLCEIATAQGLDVRDPWPYILRTVEGRDRTDLRVKIALHPGPCGDRGAIENMREGNLTVGDIFAAAFADMAENYHACASRLSPGRPWRRLVFSGGIAHKSERLRALVAARFGIDWRIAAAEDTLVGLLVLGSVVTGRASSVAQAADELRQTERGASCERTR